MSPRFDRRRDQNQGAPSGRQERRSRSAYGAAARGEWRGQGSRPASAPEGRSGGAGRKPFVRRSDGDERRFEGAAGARPQRRVARSSDRPFSPRAGSRRPDERRFEPRRPERAASRPVVIEAPAGEAERFGAAPADDLIWGRHAAQAALESDRPIHRIWCTAEMRFQPRFMQLLREAKAGGVLVEEVTWARLGQLTNGAVHQGIVLQVAAADTLDLASLIEGCRGIGEPPLLMALDGITDPHNLGAIVRSAEALGAHGLVLPQRRSAGLTGSVAKVAAGALEHLPVARVVNLNRSLDTLKQEGYRVIGLAGEGSVSLADADLDGPLVIVTGSEGSGLSMLTRKHCDQLVRIPLRGATPSLNASVATAMVLYEVARRGWMKQLSGSAPAPRIVRPQLPSAPAQRSEPLPSYEPASMTPAAPAEPPISEPVAAEPEPSAVPLSPVDGAEPAAEEQASPPQERPPAVAEIQLGFGVAPVVGFSGDIQL